MKIVAVTACPTGIAHTYMAADALSKAAPKKGLQIKVETQGAMGIENPLLRSRYHARRFSSDCFRYRNRTAGTLHWV